MPDFSDAIEKAKKEFEETDTEFAYWTSQGRCQPGSQQWGEVEAKRKRAYDNLQLVLQMASLSPNQPGVKSHTSVYSESEEGSKMQWDAFICHASEDKEDFVKPLATALSGHDLRIWYDEFTLKLGDNLRRSIDRGLSQSRFGIVVLSQAFFQKQWPQYELDGLVQREISGKDKKVILPIWHGVTRDDIMHCSPSLADKLAVRSAEGIEKVVEEILKVVKDDFSDQVITSPEMKQPLPTLEVEYIPDGSLCYLLDKDHNHYLLTVVRLKLINRGVTATTARMRTLNVQVDNSWEVAERTQQFYNQTVPEVRASVTVRNWLDKHEDVRLEGRDTKTVYVPFLLPKTINKEIEEVRVSGTAEDMDGRSAAFEAIVPRYR